MMFDAHVNITIEPVYHDDPPRVRWGVDGLQHELIVDRATVIDINQSLSAGWHTIEIEFWNKTTQDAQQSQDKAVIIKQVMIEGFTTVRLGQGYYYPIWPDDMLCQQSGLDLFRSYCHSTYLGWNGSWILPLRSPIYHWIHEQENLGFYYKTPRQS